jgi:Peptidase family M23/Lysozyme like domain
MRARVAAIVVLSFGLLLPVAASGKPPSIPRLEMPLARAQLREGFGRLRQTINEGVRFHAPLGTRVVSSHRGRVLVAGPIPGYPQAVILDHGRFFTVYAGFGDLRVKKGDWVEALTPLGSLGDQGLHFEVRTEAGDAIDPLEVLRFKLEGREKKLAEDAVAAILTRAGFPAHLVPVMTCVAYYESGWRPDATNGNTNRTMDMGLLQINDVNHRACGIRNRGELFDPEVNARCAYTVWKVQGLRAWVAYQKKRTFCDRYTL